MIRIKHLLELEERKRRDRQAQLGVLHSGGCTEVSLKLQNPLFNGTGLSSAAIRPTILKTATISPVSPTNASAAADNNQFKVISGTLIPVELPSASANSSDSDLPSTITTSATATATANTNEAQSKSSVVAESTGMGKSSGGLATGSQIALNHGGKYININNKNNNNENISNQNTESNGSNSNSAANSPTPRKQPAAAAASSPIAASKKSTALKIDIPSQQPQSNGLLAPPSTSSPKAAKLSPTAQVIQIAATTTVGNGNINDSTKPITSEEYQLPNRAEFISKVPGNGEKLQCRVIRRRESGVEKIYPYYEVYLEDPVHGLVFLMSARKRKKSKSSNYVISLDKIPDTKAKVKAVGKVRSNFLGTHFTVYSEGRNPFKSAKKDGAAKPLRSELVSVVYDTNLFGLDGPRKMTAILPAVRDGDERAEIKPVREKDTIMERYKAGSFGDLTLIRNKAPQWNDDTQSYVLNFGGRVTKASVKNFQLIDEANPEFIIMQFGRIGDNSFTMDIQRPISILQCFGIVLSSFDAKLACE